MTRYEEIVDILTVVGKPLQTKDIKIQLKRRDIQISTTTLSTLLSDALKKQKLYAIKAKGMPYFYVLPLWVKAGRKGLIFKFDPYTKTKIE